MRKTLTYLKLALTIAFFVASSVVAPEASAKGKPEQKKNLRVLYWNIQNGMWAGQPDKYEAFVQWIKEQDFYENTTIVISGDHLTMDSEFLADIDPEYTRTVYNCIINSAVQPVQEKNREFGTYDMYPTTLAAMGVKIDGDRLGLGTNLFSDKKTLTEICFLPFSLFLEKILANTIIMKLIIHTEQSSKKPLLAYSL
jgi:hypothetical protein